jgi:hypothetical protein
MEGRITTPPTTAGVQKRNNALNSPFEQFQQPHCQRGSGRQRVHCLQLQPCEGQDSGLAVMRLNIDGKKEC